MIPYWQARISEVTRHREDLAKEGGQGKEVLYVRAEDNLAYLGKTGLAKLSKLGLHSKWQAGPRFLTLPCEQWPLRDLGNIFFDKAATATGAAKLIAGGAQRASCEVLNTATLTEAQARRHQMIGNLAKYRRIRNME